MHKDMFIESCLVCSEQPLPDWVKIVDASYPLEVIPTFGSIRSLLEVQKLGHSTPGFFNLKVSDWLYPISDLCLNDEGSYFKQAFQVNESDIGKFCKSDSGFKTLEGMIIRDINDIKFIKGVVQPWELLFFAPVKYIDDEARVWMYDDKVAEISKYRGSWKSLDKYSDYVKFAKRCNLRYSPSDMYVIDLCTCDGELKIVEYNCYQSAGFYEADMMKVISAFLS